MNNQNGKVAEALGAEATKKVFTPDEVRTLVKRDVHTAILLLDAIYRDPNTLDAVADYLYGRYQNAKHKEELEAQGSLNLK